MKKRLISSILIMILSLQLLPSLAVVAENEPLPLSKTAGYQDFPAYYNDVNHAANQVTHPDVVALSQPWNGYRYWAVYTPNVSRTSIYENPSIVASNDGETWTEPSGLVNPIEPQPSSTRYHNCDADMLYNEQMNAMMAYWNWADDQAGGVGAEIRLRISYDGVHWGVPATYDSETKIWTVPVTDEDRQVASGTSDYITVISSTDRYDMLSPAFVYDDFRELYIMWTNDTGDVGYNNGQANHVNMRYSEDGITWGEPVQVENFLGKNAVNQQLAPWHQDVQFVPELKEFLCVSQCFSGNNPDGSVLHLTKSKDGMHWQQVGDIPLLSPGSDGSWDDFQIYRSSFCYVPAAVYGMGTVRVWYSALQKDTNNKLVPDSQGNLTIQAKAHDDRIWRIGYAENTYRDMMRALLDDSSYNVPSIIAGTSLTVSPNVPNTIVVGETLDLQTTFVPVTTSDQIVKFTSNDAAVAKVDAFGVVTALSAGTAQITAETYEGLTDTVDITVVSSPYILIPQSSMTATATSEHPGTTEGPASNVLDGNTDTIWHTKYNPKVELPQSVTVSFAQAKTVGKLVYTPRQVGTNGIVTKYELYAHKTGGTSILLAAGQWPVNSADKILEFTPTEATSLELKVIEGSGGFGTAAEINVYESSVSPYMEISQNTMTASATSEHPGTTEGPASNVLDGNTGTIWHTKYNPKVELPQSLTVSFGQTKTVGRIVYTPRQDNCTNGMVTSYELYVTKPDATVELVKSGEWPVNAADKEAVFLPVEATALNLKVIAGAGGFGSAAEIRVFEQNVGGTSPSPGSTESITGNGVKVVYDETANKIVLYLVDGTEEIQMSKPSSMGYPIINGQAVMDFTPVSCTIENDVTGVMGSGNRMTIVSESGTSGLTRTYILEVSTTKKGVVYTSISYTAGATAIVSDQFIENQFELLNVEDRVWSYNGGGEGPIHYYDTLQKIDLNDTSMFSRENIQNETAASIPVADIYTAEGGITVGDASATRREVRTPIEETADSAKVCIKWPGKIIAAETTATVGQSFVIAHSGDYYNGLRGYKNGMETIGMIMPTTVPDSSYDMRWESWGWGFNWTVDLIIGKLDELQAAGVKQITLDDGWYDHPGDWGLNATKFPNGKSDMLRLTDAIHQHGMTAILWWRPCDGGGPDSSLFKNHPEYFVKDANNNYARLKGPGGSNDPALGYALCPTSVGAVSSQVEFIERAITDWGFDGFKGDYIWSIPKCYNPLHNHVRPEESTEQQKNFYQETRAAMLNKNEDSFNLVCNCGVPLDYYGLKYLTQVTTADPTSVDQTRRRVKAYKALMGDTFPVTTDHNEKWYPSAVGTGAVLIEKRDCIGTDKTEYEKWLSVADAVQLQSGDFIGDLYVYGFDPYETYVVKKDDVMYYAFYRDGRKYTTTGSPDIELRGLSPSKRYRIVDYVNDRVVATNLMGNDAVFNLEFTDELLIKAVEISIPDDPNIVDPDWGYTVIDDRDSALTYTGTWVDDSNSAFYDETARYTNSVSASVQLTFYGTAVRWYGQKDTNFGSADIYIDNVKTATVNVNGPMQAAQRLYEKTDLTAAEHTLKIVCASPVIDVDKIAYKPASPTIVYTNVDALSNRITYSGLWKNDSNNSFYQGNAKYTTDENAYAEFTFTGTSICWYGQTGPTFGTADVFLDGVPAETVIQYGESSTGTLLFERNGLTQGTHTIKIVRNLAKIDIDYFAFG